MMITATQLYDHTTCPHRVGLDVHGDPARRAELSAFVRMLWERGVTHEAATVALLPADTVLLRGIHPGERQEATIAAMATGAQLIYGGRIAVGDLLGEPDILIRRGDHYVPADIKSGRAEEDGDEEPGGGRPKAAYAVQLALYVDVLERTGWSAGRMPEIWDIGGYRVPYDLDAARGPRTSGTWWNLYEATRDAVRSIAADPLTTRAALSAACGLCHWREHCREQLDTVGDLTLIPSLGRAARDALAGRIGSIAALAAVDPETLVAGRKTVFPGVGPDRLRTFHARARLLTDPDATPYAKSLIDLPDHRVEIFFDIEADPLRIPDMVYLHGFVERTDRDPATERFTGIFADDPSPEGERDAFAAAIAYLAARPDAAIFHYSRYERTMYRALQRRHPGVCTAETIEALFASPRATDLYCDVVAKVTEWPTNSHSIKSIAKFLGFRWRDTDPSGAASIEWYHRWIETGDPAIRQRIIDYNEDDCIATRVLLDGIRRLPLSIPAAVGSPSAVGRASDLF